ncbi:sugar ABC transporter ATP-binding protein [Myceligenerans indicum]|uniref:Sugar ABC transporter ATP-binding protein n=1 Tax=Myceligenerans indicum TaxID=2593663 RepID=A0ABS1LIE8_9MICO|nr:sugar ABC transporter ATP-binding protein [Myceligenerans indicum]MBL0885919.1 sugar ABC transporter ATP-binding protein [Myceligenerans indicum]
MSRDRSPRRTLVRVRELTKSFGPTTALDHVSLTVGAGEVLAVVGHNGSGKSTLVKLLAGFHAPDGGVIETRTRDGATTDLRFIHQDLGLVGTLSTVENLSLGTARGLGVLGRLRGADERREADELIRRFGVDFDVDRPVEELSPAERTIVAIARALKGWDEQQDVVVVLDEPTASLHGAEVDRLMAVVRAVAERGAGILFISHRLDEVLGMADTVVALRNGRVVGEVPCSDTDYAGLVELVAGEAVEGLDRRAPVPGDVVLRVSDLEGDTIRNVSLEVRAGEIVGVAGILGSGRDELCAAIFGGRAYGRGSIELAGRTLRPGDLRAAIRHGAAYVPGDRHKHGAVMSMTASENLAAVRIPRIEKPWARVRSRDEDREARHWFTTCGVVPDRPRMELSRFSGGNQQKVVIAKWLRTRPGLLLLEEPTQGVDIGAKSLIHRLVAGSADEGTAVLVASSEAKELAELCDRVLVLSEGELVDELAGTRLTEAAILNASVPS